MSTRWVGYDFDRIIRTQDELDAFNAEHPNYTFKGIKPELGMLVYKDHSGPDGKPDGVIDSWDRVVLRSKNFPFALTCFGSIAFGLSSVQLLSYHSAQTRFHSTLPAKSRKERSLPSSPENIISKLRPFQLPPRFRPYCTGKFLHLPKNQFYNKLFDNVRLFVTGSNLFVWSSFKYYDPELEHGNAYPIMRSFNFGVDVKF